MLGVGGAAMQTVQVDDFGVTLRQVVTVLRYVVVRLKGPLLVMLVIHDGSEV